MKHLKWNESASYLWARARHISGPPNWWFLHKLAAGTAVGLFVLGQIAKWWRGGTSQMTIWTEITICLGVGFTVGYFVPILSLLSSCRIWTNDRGLHRKRVEGPHVIVESWPWANITGYEIQHVVYNGRGFDEVPRDTDQRRRSPHRAGSPATAKPVCRSVPDLCPGRKNLGSALRTARRTIRCASRDSKPSRCDCLSNPAW